MAPQDNVRGGRNSNRRSSSFTDPNHLARLRRSSMRTLLGHRTAASGIFAAFLFPTQKGEGTGSFPPARSLIVHWLRKPLRPGCRVAERCAVVLLGAFLAGRLVRPSAVFAVGGPRQLAPCRSAKIFKVQFWCHTSAHSTDGRSTARPHRPRR